MKNEKKVLLITGILFLIIDIMVVILKGSTYTLKINVNTKTNDADQFQVSIDQDQEFIRLTEKQLENGTLLLDIESISKGKAYVDIYGPDDYMHTEVIYVHSFGIITVNTYFGNSSGAEIIPILMTAYITLLLCYVIILYRRGMQVSIYQYKNIRNLAWIIFLVLMLAGQISLSFYGNSLDGAVRSILNSASYVAIIIFPIAFFTSILVAISNVQLIRKEGHTLKNLLGLILGLCIFLGTILPVLLSEYLQRSTIIDVHNENGIAMYVEMAVTNTVLVTLSYLECILLAAVILTFKAARKIPSFDKDYILILGCRIRKDGTLTPLLKGRTDRALEFARMQKEASGKNVIFVPSGGKGADEIMPEACAIRNYLIDTGISEDQILVEDSSTNTYENFKKSMDLIQRNRLVSDPRIAFSTTNYHVFRSGILARQQGIHAEGIGGKTRSYFGINAFIREFIATVFAERKKHLVVIAALVLLTLALVFVMRMSNIL